MFVFNFYLFHDYTLLMISGSLYVVLYAFVFLLDLTKLEMLKSFQS